MVTAKTKFLLAVVLSISMLSTFAQDFVADNMLMFQRKEGGWPKHYQEKAIDYNRTYTIEEKALIADERGRNDATIDNGATSKEIRYLLKTYKKINNTAYLQAAQKGIQYLLNAQYKNGGFPQFYPDLSSYRHAITFNDDAMINALNILYDVVHRTENFEVVDSTYIPKCDKAIKRGIECILKTQVTVNKKLTAWCAQHDEVTFMPIKARKFELESISGLESVNIVRFLMKVENPNEKIKLAITSAINWFQKSKLVGYAFIEVPDKNLPKGKDRVLVQDSTSIIWARFYDIDTNIPFVCGRDGIKKYKLSEIEHERRIGYAWYGTWPKNLLEKDYPNWKKKNNIN